MSARLPADVLRGLLWRWFTDYDAYPADSELMKDTARMFVHDTNSERAAIAKGYLSDGYIATGKR